MSAEPGQLQWRHRFKSRWGARSRHGLSGSPWAVARSPSVISPCFRTCPSQRLGGRQCGVRLQGAHAGAAGSWPPQLKAREVIDRRALGWPDDTVQPGCLSSEVADTERGTSRAGDPNGSTRYVLPRIISFPCLFVPAHCGGQPPPFALACSATRACAGSLSRWMSAAAPPHTAPRAAKASSGCRHLASETPKKVLLGVERPSHDKAIEPFEGRPEPLSGSACEGCPSAPTHGLVPERRRHGRRPGAG
jgi:hypothetical protein